MLNRVRSVSGADEGITGRQMNLLPPYSCPSYCVSGISLFTRLPLLILPVPVYYTKNIPTKLLAQRCVVQSCNLLVKTHKIGPI